MAMDILVDSGMLKAALVKKFNDSEYDYMLVAAKVGIDPGKLNHYLSNYDFNYPQPMEHKELLRLCDFLNVEVTLKIKSLYHKKHGNLS